MRNISLKRVIHYLVVPINDIIMSRFLSMELGILIFFITFIFAGTSTKAVGIIAVGSNYKIGMNPDLTVGVAYHIDEMTGASTYIGNPGTPFLNSLARNSKGTLYSAAVNQLMQINQITGIATPVVTLPDFSNIRALAFSDNDILYAIQKNPYAPSHPNYEPCKLYVIDITDGSMQWVADIPNTGIQALTFNKDGALYGWDCGLLGTGLGLITIDPLTGAIADVNTSIGGTALQIQSLAFSPNGVLYGMRENLYTVDIHNGTLDLVSTGYKDIRGIEFIPEPATLSLLALGAFLARRKRRK